MCLWKGCKVYNTPSTSQSWLQRHMLTHSGDKPFKVKAITWIQCSPAAVSSVLLVSGLCNVTFRLSCHLSFLSFLFFKKNFFNVEIQLPSIISFYVFVSMFVYVSLNTLGSH